MNRKDGIMDGTLDGITLSRIDEIDASLRLRLPIRLESWLVGGELRPWAGTMSNVFSPVPILDSYGPGPLILGSIPEQGEAEAKLALDAAVTAWSDGDGDWPALGMEERARRVLGFTTALRGLRKQLVLLMMWEVGKVYSECENEFDRTIEYIEESVDAALELTGEGRKDAVVQDVIARFEYAPIGVSLCIGPYNYPLYETFTNVVPALLMGNTVIIKPPPHGALLYTELLHLFRRYFPAGAVNTVFGEETLPPLMESGRIDVLAFIGTSAVADSLIAQHPAPHRLHSILGMEAKNPAVVLADADLEHAAAECVKGALAFNGQRCAAIKIIFVHSSIASPFMSLVKTLLDDTTIGMPWDDVRITPVISTGHADYLSELLEDATGKGAEILNRQGGERLLTLITPALLWPVRKGMRLFEEEQFGPLIPLVTFDDIEEPLTWMRESRYGQQMSVFGNDAGELSRVVRVAGHQVGRVNVNSKCQRGPDRFPFTGKKDSALGIASIEDTLHLFSTKTVIASPSGGDDLSLWDALHTLNKSGLG